MARVAAFQQPAICQCDGLTGIQQTRPEPGAWAVAAARTGAALAGLARPDASRRRVWPAAAPQLARAAGRRYVEPAQPAAPLQRCEGTRSH